MLEKTFAPVIHYLSVDDAKVENVATLKEKYASLKKKIDTFIFKIPPSY